MAHDGHTIAGYLKTDRFVEADTPEDFCESLAKEQIDDEAGETIDDPNFDEGGTVHNWRIYIPRKLRQQWGELSYEKQCYVIAHAAMISIGEQWD